MNIYELHEKMTAHLFTSYSNSDQHFLTVALCGEIGELANFIKKRVRDGTGPHDYLYIEECRDEIADARVYLELLAKCFDYEGDKLLLPEPQLDNNFAGDELFLALILVGKAGLLADLVAYRWMNEKAGAPDQWEWETKSAISTVRLCIELIAKYFDIGGDKLDQRVEEKLKKVVEKHKAKLTSQPDETNHV